MDEPFEPRSDDHLVEPFFGGLGVTEESRAETGEARQPDEPAPGWLRRLVTRISWWRR